MASAAATASLAVLSLVLLASGAEAAGSTFVSAQDGNSCGGICSSQGLTSATMRQSDGVMQTSVCEVNVTGQGRLSGYQEGGSSTCNVVVNSTAHNSSDYSCLCLESEAQAGLATADSNSCSSACNQDVDGMTGSAVATESSEASYTCVPSTEIGHLNRFGFTTDLGGGASICTAAIDGSATATPEFSCFCTFQPQDSSNQKVTPATSGSTSSSDSSQTLSSEDSDATAVGG